MPSASPSPIKRPSLNERTSSTHSLSSSSRQATGHKAHRSHVASRHSRNVSHGKGLSKLGKVHSTTNVSTDYHHQRKKSGGPSPPHSPKVPLVKRNSSNVTLPKNTSHGNLRKNHSANTLIRNVSHPALKKTGLAPAPKPKNKEKKDGVFQLGDRSSDDEEEGEWEDSTTQSPEITRNNSKTSTPRVSTPNGEQIPRKLPESGMDHPDETPSPSNPSLKNHTRSVPNLRKESSMSPSQIPPDPALLHQYPRASRAPPAMSTVSAHVTPGQLIRSESSRSFSHISHVEAASMNVTPTTPGLAAGPVPASSSVEGGVSHFLPMETPSSSLRPMGDGSDDDSPSNFLSNYKPQPPESPGKTKTLHKARTLQNPSRTQQKLELQRREIMRAGAATPTTPPPTGMGLNLGSSTSLHSRTGSKNRNRSLAGGRTLTGDIKALKQDYENAIKQLTVVGRFRNPIVESMNRLKENNVLPPDIGVISPSGAFSKSRPQSRRGPSSFAVNGQAKASVSRSFEDKKPSPLVSRSCSRGRGGRVHFQRQSSHDDIEVTPSQGSPDGVQDDEQDGLSPEEALMRRIWESREVLDAGEPTSAR
ncbi:uncharacterized protein Z518_03985 [Rhinocladiella mackenziei CBS 650.93]|uniref:Rhinocladiella mackenziei CBS 650.93 unplaced genomic scaffold supercont1.3, whole genome shotgun sequence n=1 Tax=Rhinocladiella mackenziei CBS 650.93 TaxID=1442369 RepID=A0A0D2ISD5_9EURO|nr:uncharacterized protein Z518_03985 [Rhinocladiella mackenziei CBS 650.93]KIX06011.1 hypothetical protein Z518_03985 [Rhinocladiella mackenziei CBS 650.93]